MAKKMTNGPGSLSTQYNFNGPLIARGQGGANLDYLNTMVMHTQEPCHNVMIYLIVHAYQ